MGQQNYQNQQLPSESLYIQCELSAQCVKEKHKMQFKTTEKKLFSHSYLVHVVQVVGHHKVHQADAIVLKTNIVDLV